VSSYSTRTVRGKVPNGPRFLLRFRKIYFLIRNNPNPYSSSCQHAADTPRSRTAHTHWSLRAPHVAIFWHFVIPRLARSKRRRRNMLLDQRKVPRERSDDQASKAIQASATVHQEKKKAKMSNYELKPWIEVLSSVEWQALPPAGGGGGRLHVRERRASGMGATQRPHLEDHGRTNLRSHPAKPCALSTVAI